MNNTQKINGFVHQLKDCMDLIRKDNPVLTDDLKKLIKNIHSTCLMLNQYSSSRGGKVVCMFHLDEDCNESVKSRY